MPTSGELKATDRKEKSVTQNPQVLIKHIRDRRPPMYKQRDAEQQEELGKWDICTHRPAAQNKDAKPFRQNLTNWRHESSQINQNYEE
jgi:hypothetical protein